MSVPDKREDRLCPETNTYINKYIGASRYESVNVSHTDGGGGKTRDHGESGTSGGTHFAVLRSDPAGVVGTGAEAVEVRSKQGGV